MKEKAWVVVFTLLVTACFGGLVSTVKASLADRIARNQVVAEQRVVLELLGTDTSSLTDEAVVERFADDVAITRYDLPDQPRPYETYAAKGSPGVTVLPIYGQGFWAPIGGFLALDTGSGAVRGVAFTDQAETPGLGGRIVETDFREQFDGMRLDLDAARRRFIRMTPPDSPNGPAEFDAVTGATETSRAVERILNRSIGRFLAITDDDGRETTP
jgi:Na+-transporting NADH:ubiquinone oxidoreductase subunit C